MPEPALVSVILPTYKRVPELRLAVRSVLAQTHAALDVLVVSDGPDAEARAAIEGIDPRVRYLELAVNSGPAEARNTGVRASHGEWLVFLDDDDTMLPDRVAHALAAVDIASPERMIACRTVYRRGEERDVWPLRPLGAEEELADYLLIRPSLLGRPGVLPIQSLMVHRSICERVPFTTHGDHEDWAWLLDAWHLVGARVSFVWEPMVEYNIATESLSRSRRLNWRDSLDWATLYRDRMSARAFNSFLSTKVALKAKRAGDWKGLWTVGRMVLRNQPDFLNFLFLAGMWLLPRAVLQGAWKYSLRNR